MQVLISLVLYLREKTRKMPPVCREVLLWGKHYNVQYTYVIMANSYMDIL